MVRGWVSISSGSGVEGLRTWRAPQHAPPACPRSSAPAPA